MKNNKISFIKVLCMCLMMTFFLSCDIDMQKVYRLCNNVMENFEMAESKEKSRYWIFQHELSRTINGFITTDTLRQLLQEGLDPNYCIGEFGWFEANPLMIVANSRYTTFERLHIGEQIPNPTPDTNVIHILVEYGADINRRPYIWYIIHRSGSEDLNKLWEMRSEFTVNDEPDVLPSEEERYKTLFIEDENRLLRAFLRNGADPDKLGHPYPFSREMLAKITDEEANAYFSKGTRPINEAIEKGILWESQVDLLLEYTTLDEESLKSAERSGDSAMVKKIQRRWKEQNEKQ